MTTPTSANTVSTAEREAFEAWATENCHLSGSKFHKWDNGDYLDRDLAKAWFGWQARAVQSQPVIPTGTPAAAVPAIQVQEPVAEKGPWRVLEENNRVFVESGDFTHDVRLYVNGDFGSYADGVAYAVEIARRLNAATPQPEQTSSEEYWGRPGKRLDDHLAQMEGVRKAVEELKAEYMQPEQTALMQGIHDAAVKAGIIKEGTPLTGAQCLMLLKDLASLAQQSNAPALSDEVLQHARDMVKDHYPAHREYKVAAALLAAGGKP